MQDLLKQLTFVTSHKLRKSVATCMGLINLIDPEDPHSVEEIKHILRYLKTTIHDLDEETRNMSLLLHDTKQQSECKFESSFYKNINKNPG
jgi:hypothetical protein